METSGASGSAAGAGTRPGQAGPSADAPATTWRSVVDRTLAALGEAASARLRVLRVEAGRAVQVSVAAIVLVAVALLMLATAWFALVGAIISWAVLAGFQWHWVLLATAASCVLLGWLGIRSARASFSTIRFDATARTLRLSRTGADATSPGMPR